MKNIEALLYGLYKTGRITARYTVPGGKTEARNKEPGGSIVKKQLINSYPLSGRGYLNEVHRDKTSYRKLFARENA